jgi:hypothetical protein
MDVSGALHVLLREYETSKGLFFENHVYGCISLLEQWIEGSLELSGSHVTFEEGSPPFDLETQWDQIGSHHGFYRPLVAEAPYEGSPEYKAFWVSLFRGPVLTEPVLDVFEEAVWKAYKQIGAVYFCGALATGDLTPELLEKGLASATVVTAAVAATVVTAAVAATVVTAAVVPVVPVVPVAPSVPTTTPEQRPNRRRKTRDAPGNRIITPIKTHRRFALTRKVQGHSKGVSL